MDHNWSIMHIDKMGFDSWAHFAVGARTQETDTTDSGQCQECNAHSIRTWQAWCAACWNGYHERAAKERRRKETAGLTAADAGSAKAGWIPADPNALTVAMPVHEVTW